MPEQQRVLALVTILTARFTSIMGLLAGLGVAVPGDQDLP